MIMRLISRVFCWQKRIPFSFTQEPIVFVRGTKSQVEMYILKDTNPIKVNMHMDKLFISESGDTFSGIFFLIV